MGTLTIHLGERSYPIHVAPGILDRAALREVRGEVRLLQKIERSLLEDAVEELHNTKGIHDRLESYYRPHLDFDAMDRKTEELLQTIFG